MQVISQKHDRALGTGTAGEAVFFICKKVRLKLSDEAITMEEAAVENIGSKDI